MTIFVGVLKDSTGFCLFVLVLWLGNELGILNGEILGDNLSGIIFVIGTWSGNSITSVEKERTVSGSLGSSGIVMNCCSPATHIFYRV